jgi:hypothetical protein
MTIAPRLVRLIETHSEQLVRSLLDKLQHSGRLTEFVGRVPPDEIRFRVREIYQHLGDWLLNKTEGDIEKWYTAIGWRRASQGVPLHQLLWAIITTKETLWEFLKHEGLVDRHVELFQELELFNLVDRFFDRALYYATIGYAQYKAARAA